MKTNFRIFSSKFPVSKWASGIKGLCTCFQTNANVLVWDEFKNTQLLQGLRSCRMYKRKLQNVQKVFVCYSFQPWSLLSAPSLFNISPLPPMPESARCDYSDLAIANIRLRPSILFLACHLVWLLQLKTWLCQTTEKGKICSCCLSCTLLFSYIFRVSPFAWRCMTCFPRFSAVSIWEKATGLGFPSWDEEQDLRSISRRFFCQSICAFLSRECFGGMRGVRSHNSPGQLRNAECWPFLTAIFMTGHSRCELLQA